MADLVDITPHVSLMHKLGQSGHSVADAVAELVDNALDARRGDHVRVEVSFDAREGWLEITDDGHGMTRSELAAALVLAQSEKTERKIGRFGLGLKTACTSLGAQFEIETAGEGASFASIVTYDATEFAAAGTWKLPISRRRKRFPSGTRIRIDSDRVYASLGTSLQRNLAWTFRHFLVGGQLTILLNGTPLAPAEYDVDPESVLPLSGTVADRQVRGWVALLNQSSQRGWYGFALVRHGRVVRRHEKLGFQSHPSTARVVGELHLDAFPTNNLKTDFIRETAEWRDLEEWVSKAIQPVLAASRALAHAGLFDMRIRAAIAEQRAANSGDDEDLHLPRHPEPVSSRESRHVSLVIDTLHLEHVWINERDRQAPYMTVDRLERPDAADLVVVASNLAHPACGTVSDRSGWACHNLAETAAELLFAGRDFRAVKSALLLQLLDQRSLRRELAATAAELLKASHIGDAPPSSGLRLAAN